MRYPTLPENPQLNEMAVTFTGYDHRPSCTEGSYFDMKNMTNDYLPAMASRKRRGIEHTFTKFQGMINKDGLVWVDNGVLYIDGTAKAGFTLTNSGMKDISKMGAYLTFLPDKKWYNTADNTYGEMQAYYDNTHWTSGSIDSYGTMNFKMSNAQGEKIEYIMESAVTDLTPDGTIVLRCKQEEISGQYYGYDYHLATYRKSSKTYRDIPVTNIRISNFRINKPAVSTTPKSGYYGNSFPIKEGDGVKLVCEWYDPNTNPSRNTYPNEWTIFQNVFPNEESKKKRYGIFTVDKLIERVVSSTEQYYDIVISLNEAFEDTNLSHYKVSIERLVPDLKYTIECNNRLWGCSNDGHEIYATKLGDVSNWNYFAGTSIDSWAVNLGSDGVFTGCAVLQGNPVFFKENYIIKIQVSSIGAHSMREVNQIGVEEGSEESLVRINEVLYYKALDGIYAYDGSYPIKVSDKLGDVKYKDAVGGNLGGMYYVSMKDESNVSHVFVYDIQHGLWFKEDNSTVKQFCKYKENLYFVEGETLYVRDGYKSTTKEGVIDWFVVSGDIGYLYTSKRQTGRINKKSYINKLQINAQMKEGSHMSVYIQYDSSDEWEFVWNISGKGTRLFNVPIKPRRCDHFKYKIVGHGDAKIFSITKTYTDGSEL